MKRVLAVALVCVVGFAVVYRQRLFLRDPLAVVTRDGVKASGVVTMINYSNDVLLLDASDAARARAYLVQGWNKVAAVPTAPLKCESGLACMTDADRAAAVAIVPGARGRREQFEGVTVTNRRVAFVDEGGALVEVKLR